VSDTPSEKIDPPELTLRPNPPPVTRLSKRALIGLGTAGGALVLGLGLWALDPPGFFSRGDGTELYNTDPRPGAEGLAALPRDYSGVPRALPPGVPQLGPPLPGDLGRPMLEAQGGLTPPPSGPTAPGAVPPPGPPQPDPEVIRAREEAEAARRSRLFFQNATRPDDSDAQAAPGGLPPLSGLGAFGVQPATGSATAPPQVDGSTRDEGFAQNMQDRKEAFLDPTSADRETLSQNRMQRPASPYQLMAGTVLSASLITGLNSDLPGLVEAHVTEHVFDTVSGRHCLVPQGSRLIGRYDSNVAFGQSRALVAWTRLIRPDGTSVVLDRLPATDPAGFAGLEDQVDRHWWRLAGAALLSTVLGAGAELSAGDEEDRLIRALRRGGQDSTTQVGQQLTRRNLNVQPTITVRPGWPLRVIVAKDIVMSPYGRAGEGTCPS